MKRLLNPATNPLGHAWAGAWLYALAQAFWNAQHLHIGAASQPVWISFIAGAAAAIIRAYVTPTADPRLGAGKSLSPLSVIELPQASPPTPLRPAPQPGPYPRGSGPG